MQTPCRRQGLCALQSTGGGPFALKPTLATDDSSTAQGCPSLLSSSLSSVVCARVRCPSAPYPAFLCAPRSIAWVPHPLTVVAGSACHHISPPSEALPSIFSSVFLGFSVGFFCFVMFFFWGGVLWVLDKGIGPKKKENCLW